MNERSAANKLDGVFSDMRINPVYLAMVTREIFGRNTSLIAADWWMYHNMDLESRIRGDNGPPYIDLGIEYDSPFA